MSHRNHIGNRILARSIVPSFLLCVVALSASGQTAVLTQHNDTARTGQNTNETILTTSNVNVNQFGKVFSLPTDGQVYAQPLYVPTVNIAGGTHNVLMVATENDSVYAFDADSNMGANAAPLWKASMVDAAHGATSGETTVSVQRDLDPQCTDLIPQVGITSTPVIDLSTGTMYVEAKSKKANGTYVHRLHMLDITTGAEKSPGPVEIAATVAGMSDGSTTVNFDALHNLSRPGLLLLNGTVYLGYASHCDFTRYHGWIFAYNASTLAKTAVFLTTPNLSQGQGGIWMSGAGIAADANGNIFTAVGNGSYGATDLGDSILKLALSGNKISLSDYFTPFDQGIDDASDLDVGSGGVLLLPDQPGNHPHELLEGTKGGTIYLIDRDQMTTNNQHYCSGCTSDPEIIQEIHIGNQQWLWAMPAYWNSTVYFWGSNDVLRAYTLSNGLLGGPSSSSTNSFGFPGATPSISANGNTNGIVWVIDSTQFGNPGPGPGPAVVRAYDAMNVAKELWNSSQAPNNRDTAGNAVKFTVPTISNGKVYAPTSIQVDVYGLLNGGTPVTAAPVITPASESVTSPVQVAITDTTSGASVFFTTDGTTPSPTHGTQYTSPFVVNTTSTVRAMAAASGASNSAVVSEVYTIESNPFTSLNFANGFSVTGMTLSGNATMNGTRLRLTDAGGSEAGSGFFNTPMNVQSFKTDFGFQLTNAGADGFTFTIHGGSTPGALGPLGGGLGYGPDKPTGAPGIPSSVAVKFDLYSNNGEGTNSTGIYPNGQSPTTPFIDMTGTGIDLHSGDIFHVNMTYDGTNLAMTITDTSTQASLSHTFQIDIPKTVGGSTGFVGFTGGTGGLTALQEIIDWSYVSGPAAQSPAAAPTFSPPAGTYTSTQSLTLGDTSPGVTIHYTTDGTTPTINSTLFSAAIFVSQTTTINAIAAGGNFSPSPVASATYTMQLSTATPLISPATGTFSSPQTVTITDSPSNAPIHYTTDGSTPTAASTLYSGSFAVSTTTTVKAIAVGNGSTASGVASSTITIQTAVTSISFGSGFSGSGMTLNGGASLQGTRLRLTDGGVGEARSAFFPTLVNVQSFTTNFSFQITPASTTTADGFTFAIQADRAAALGSLGGGLGYGPDKATGAAGIPKSLAVKFDLYNNAGEGVDSTGIYTNGISPTMPAQDMSSSGINLHSGDVFKVQMTYSGTSLVVTITDATTAKSFSTTFTNVNIPLLVGGNTAFAGFTAGTGGLTATQEIISWTYSTSTVSNAPIQYETESSTVFNASKSSGPTYRVFPWTGFTGGNGTILDATAAGQSVTMQLNVAQPGTYDVKYAVKMKNLRGISQLAVNGVPVGPAEDQYSAADAFQEFDVGNVTIATAGNQSFTFTITGKNAASAGFPASFDYIKLTPQ